MGRGFCAPRTAKASPITCEACFKHFGTLTRKHQCAQCKQVFCHDCTNHFIPLADLSSVPVRLCSTCFRSIMTQPANTTPNRLHTRSRMSSAKSQPQAESQSQPPQPTRPSTTESQPPQAQALAISDTELFFPIPFNAPMAVTTATPENPGGRGRNMKHYVFSWAFVKQQLVSPNPIRTEDPRTLFKDMVKVAEGGQGVVFRAKWVFETPQKLDAKAIFIQSESSSTLVSKQLPKKFLRSLITRFKRTSITENSKSFKSNISMSAFFTPAGKDIHITPTAREVAIKTVHLTSIRSLDLVRNEIAITRRSQHPNIVTYIDTFVSESDLWMVLEYMHGGALSVLLDKCQRLAEPEIAYLLRNLLQGLAFLHSRHCIHRDIKSDNVLLDFRGEVKLSDFGFAALLTEDAARYSVIGTPYWMAPEVIRGAAYGASADIWSLGITVIECIDGLPPLINEPPVSAMLFICSRAPPVPAKPHSPLLADFLSHCLVLNAAERWTASQLLNHPFLATACEPEVWAQTVAQFHAGVVVA